MRHALVHPALPLATIVLVVFARVCAHDFVGFDDPQTIATNPAFNPPTLGSVLSYWEKSAEKLYIPVTYSVWGVLASVAQVDRSDEMGSRLNPWVFHTANVLLHLASSLLALRILLQLTGRPLAALFGAAIFAVHPVQVEAVAWASGTKDLLCGAFGSGAIYAALRLRDGATSHPATHVATRKPARWQAAGMGCLLMALLSKPTAVVIPLIAIAIDVLVRHTSWRRSLATFWPWLLIAVPFIVIGRMVQPPVIATLPPFWARPLIAGDALTFYLGKLIWPFNLGLDYGRAPSRIMQQGWFYVAWILPAVLALVIFGARHRWPLIAAGGAIAVIGLLPVLGLVPFTFQSISTVADHYLYLSMLGIGMIVAAIFARWDATSLRIIGVAVVAALGIRAVVQAGTWQNDRTLFEQALRVNPGSALSRTNLAMYLFRHDDFDGAMAQLEQAVRNDPDYAFARFNLARLLALQGRRDEAAAQYRELLRIYSTQRNYDPKLAADTRAAIDALLSRERHPATSTRTSIP